MSSLCRDTSSSGGSSTAGSSSRKGDEVELVSRFLAPLCARDEAARNIALAAARNTVEGWLGGCGSPSNTNANNNWEQLLLGRDCCEDISGSSSSGSNMPHKFVSPLKTINANYRLQLQRDSFDSGSFFPQSLPPDSLIAHHRKPSFDDKYQGVDCVDGGSSRERRYSESSLEIGSDEKQQRSSTKQYIRIRNGRQKQFNEDDELDDDTRAYGKSPKFDDGFALRQQQLLQRHGCELITGEAEKVVFNTLDGFLNDDKSTQRAAVPDDAKDEASFTASQEKKLSVGQIKRPLSQDDDVPWKSGRVANNADYGPPVEVVTPGEVGRLLNLGNALDGTKQSQPANLALISLHLPVILRLSVNCPFQNVRIKCAEIIQMVKERGLPVPEPAFDGPSSFVPVSEDINEDTEKIIKIDSPVLGVREVIHIKVRQRVS
ncbi:hypothetical protein TKK_0002136 [Trichogramma kaykai]|uniref:Uncharacterized protein n=1 Tax=Trichogramma kaykai TaxID=54128 RepID=A0ABD2XC06_9HYME